MALNEDILRLLYESVLCWLATSSADGQPSVSPKEIFLPYKNDSIIIANVASPNSARNIKANPKACVSFINIFTQRGYQVTGRAEYITQEHDSFQPIAFELRKLAGDDIPFKSAFQIHADSIKEILAPRYRLFPETTEQDQIDNAMLTYRVRPQDQCNP